MRFIHVKDVARLCSGLSRSVREGRGEVYVRWDWRSLCETSALLDDDETDGSESNENEPESDQDYLENDAGEDNNDAMSINNCSNSDSDSDTPITEELVQDPITNTWEMHRMRRAGSSSSTLEQEDIVMSEYHSQQPTRRPSLVEPRMPPATIPPFSPYTSTEASSSNAFNTFELPSALSSTTQDAQPQLIWVRIMILKSSLSDNTSSSPTFNTQNQQQDEQDESLTCIITALPNVQSKTWPSSTDVSDSTRGKVSLDHESGPWTTCFRDFENSMSVLDSARERKGRREAGIIEKVTVRVLGSVFRYALAFQRRFGSGGGAGRIEDK
ncbi:UNVERIFIED_CONTAM: hypothetical protein HDU68_010485 [Siphonaria sp. JEL0065]|nr:hypothetical protein HDU68_010485 [Siphonaria sp. JEL0065]